MRGRFYFSPSGDGWRNLAADECFLDALGPEDFLLYLYVNENAVILGRNQNPWRECDLEAMERDGVQLVRRVTGGGAVYHDGGNLNYSFLCGRDAYDPDGQAEIILRAVRALGVPAEKNGRNDLVAADGRKFSGRAFCARGEMRQHHGTLLVSSDLSRMSRYLRPSAEKLRSKGVASVQSRVCNLSQLLPGLTVARAAAALREACEEAVGPLAPLGPEDPALAGIAPYEARQRSWEWRLGKSPDFDVSWEGRFPWGEAQLFFAVSEGTVRETKLYTDAMDAALPERVRALCAGRRFDDLPAVLAAAGGEAADLASLLRRPD